MDPIYRNEDGQWYFYDETWAHIHGPYHSYEKAKEQLMLYCAVCLGAGEPDTEKVLEAGGKYYYFDINNQYWTGPYLTQFSAVVHLNNDRNSNYVAPVFEVIEMVDEDPPMVLDLLKTVDYIRKVEMDLAVLQSELTSANLKVIVLEHQLREAQYDLLDLELKKASQ